MPKPYTAPRPMHCYRCGERIEVGQEYTYTAISKAGASAAVHVGCEEGKG